MMEVRRYLVMIDMIGCHDASLYTISRQRRPGCPLSSFKTTSLIIDDNKDTITDTNHQRATKSQYDP